MRPSSEEPAARCSEADAVRSAAASTAAAAASRPALMRGRLATADPASLPTRRRPGRRCGRTSARAALRGLRRLIELRAVEVGVEAAVAQQVTVPALLHDAPVVHDEDAVGVHDG